MPRNEIAIGILRISDADVAERVDDALIGENAVGDGEFMAQFGRSVRHSLILRAGTIRSTACPALCRASTSLAWLAMMKPWMAGHTRAFSRATSDALCPTPDEKKGAHCRSSGQCVLGASDPGEKIGEFFLDLASQLGARPRNAGEIRQALERPAGIDDGARIGRARLVEQRIERPTPGAAHEFDVICGVAARAYRPHDVEQVARIDVFVDHDDEAAEIGG